MIVNAQNMKAIFEGFSAAFTKGLHGTTTHYRDVAMIVPSSSRENHYAWLGQLPGIREWLGDRIVNNLATHGFKVENRDFESTISVARNDIEDDNYGVFGPLFQEMGRTSAEHPDELIFSLLATGFSSTCYDGQYFFDTDHPVLDTTGNPQSVSNMQAGAGAPWFLLDTTRAIRPLLFQERAPYKLTRLDNDRDEPVFWRKEYVYGVDARVNAGFGLWQLAYASKATLDATNSASARAAMQSLKGDKGRPLNVRPNKLVVPPSLEAAGRDLLAPTLANGASNTWQGTADLIVVPWLG